MELEHLFQQTTFFMTLQALFVGSVYLAEQTGRGEMVHRFIRSMAGAVVSYGPFSLLVYVLFEVSKLS